MERRTLLFIVLSLGIWYGWLVLFPPPEPDPADTDPTEAPAPGDPDPAPTPAVPAPSPPVAAAAAGPETVVPLESCGGTGDWTSRGGAIRDLTYPEFRAPLNVTALYSWVFSGFSGSWSPYGEDPGPARIVSAEGSAFAAGAGDDLDRAPVDLVGAGLGGVGQFDDLRIEQKITPKPGDVCVAEVTYSWTNTGSAAYNGNVWVSAHDTLPEDGGGMMARYTSTQGASAFIDGEVWTFYEYGELTGPEHIEGPAGWFGIADRYFAAYLVPPEAHGTIAQTRVPRGEGHLDGMHWLIPVELAPGATHTETLTLYIGTKDLDVMSAVHEDLGSAVELGWFSFFARPLLYMLKLFYMAVGNWGVAIILLTFTVKIVFFPLTQSAFKSGQGMSAIQPELAKIREEFADNQEELNRRTMELFKEHKVNPLGGCLPMLVQFPVWIALYNVLLSSVELYQTEFLYLRDLSSVDPYGILPVIVVVLIMIQQQFTPTAATMDPAQARMMKVMPLMFGVFFFTFPAGLVVYIFVNTVLSVLQQWFIRRNYATPQTSAEGAK